MARNFSGWYPLAWMSMLQIQGVVQLYMWRPHLVVEQWYNT